MSEEKNVKAEEKKAEGKKSFLDENKLEIITVILLGITALLTAWASYVGSMVPSTAATRQQTMQQATISPVTATHFTTQLSSL